MKNRLSRGGVILALTLLISSLSASRALAATNSARYSVTGQPTSFVPGGSGSYRVTVTNIGSSIWQSAGTTPFHLGIHFVNSSGGSVTDQRWALTRNLYPGQSVTMTVTVTAPGTPGTYTLQEQMVQEGIGWFSQYLNTTVSVGSTSPTPSPSPSPTPSPTPSPSPSPTPSPSACPGSQSGCIGAMLNILNADRAQSGVAPLTLNMTETNGTSACVGSYGHSVHMSQVGSISHDQFPADICIGFSTAGENVGEASYGNELTDLQHMDSMMMSEPHDATTCSTTNNHACNILNRNFHQVGIGIYTVNNTTWLTEDFTN